MINIDYKLLKSNYSTSAVDIHNCSMHFPNTCAIRMSEALVKTDSRFLTVFKGAGTNKCPHFYIRGAQDLASVLSKVNALGPRNVGWTATANGKAPMTAVGKKGIVCYMNIPGFSGQGHIDLWDGVGPVGSDYWNAETVWMWELK